jgi:hypothetical protein
LQIPSTSYYGSATASPNSAVSKDPFSVDNAKSLKPLPDSSASDSVEKQFLNYAHMNPIDRMRAGILKSMGLTEDSLKSMPADQQKAVEEKIRQLIEQQMQKNADKKGQLIDVSA